MVEFIKACGAKTNCMEMVFTLGLTVGSTKVSTKMTRSTGMEFTLGPMERSMTEAGKMANSTVKLGLQTLKIAQNLDFGKMERK